MQCSRPLPRPRAGAPLGAALCIAAVLAAAAAAAPPDFDGRNGVDPADLVHFIEQFRARAGQWDRAADLNGDGALDHQDARLMIEALLAEAVADARQLVTTMRQTASRFVTIGQNAPDNPDLEGFARWLQRRDDIVSAEVQEDGVAARTTGGISLLFSPAGPDVLGGGSSAAPALPSLSRLLPLTSFALPRAAQPQALACLGQLVPLGPALLINALPADRFPCMTTWADMLRQVGFNPTIEDADTLTDFSLMSRATVTIVKTHGNIWTDPQRQRHFILLACIVETSNASGVVPYIRMSQDGTALFVCRYIWRSSGNTDEIVGAEWFTYLIADRWFPTYIQSLPDNAAVIFVTCNGARLTEPARTFHNMGAQVYFGFTRKVMNGWATAWTEKFLDRLTGLNLTDEWDRPPRRPQNFRDALDYIAAHPRYDKDPDFGARPKVFLKDGDDTNFALAPYIGAADLQKSRDWPQNRLLLYGAFGCGQGRKVLLGSRELTVISTGSGNGQPLTVRLPRTLAGRLQVQCDGGKRISNPVTVSHFRATVTLQCQTVFGCRGTVTLRYTEQVLGHRLYRTILPRLMFGGWDSRLADPPVNQYPLCAGTGDWQLEWHFNDTVDLGGGGSVTVTGDGTASGRRQPDTAGCGASVGVMLEPWESAPDANTCAATVNVSVSVGPLHTVMRLPGGTTESDDYHFFFTQPAGGTLGAPATYNQLTATLQAADGLLQPGGSWHMDAVALDPRPPGLSQVAAAAAGVAAQRNGRRLLPDANKGM